jgi:hypothetical protein
MSPVEDGDDNNDAEVPALAPIALVAEEMSRPRRSSSAAYGAGLGEANCRVTTSSHIGDGG